MCRTTGAHYFPQRGPVVPGRIRSERLLTGLSGALRLRVGLPFHRACYRARVNPTGIDLPVTDRMRMSASEP
jgi:hypothetical protein